MNVSSLIPFSPANSPLVIPLPRLTSSPSRCSTRLHTDLEAQTLIICTWSSTTMEISNLPTICWSIPQNTSTQKNSTRRTMSLSSIRISSMENRWISRALTTVCSYTTAQYGRVPLDTDIVAAMKELIFQPTVEDPPILAEAEHTWHIENWRSLPRREHGPIFEAGGFPW